ncbi:unnamed protein product [Discula destructiva]
MGFLDVGDGEGGSVEDRIAIVCVVAFAFCWIPIFLVWKCITVIRRKDGGVEAGNAPVTTRNVDAEKSPYDPAPEPKRRTKPSTGHEGRTSTRHGERRSSRGDQHVKNAPETPRSRDMFDSARGDQQSEDHTQDEPSYTQTNQLVEEGGAERVHDGFGEQPL